MLKVKVIGFLAAMCVPGMALASSIPATEVLGSVVGTNQGTANDRDNINNILGDSDGKFYELGLGGSVDLGFGGDVLGPIEVIEVTFGNRDAYFESFDVFVGFNNVFTFIGNVNNSVATALIQYAQIFDTVRLVDTTPLTTGGGGADIDSVSVGRLARVNEVPLPAAAWLFLSVLGGAGAMRRFGAKTK